MPVITFYEVDEVRLDQTALPRLSEVEKVIFDHVNDQGAASQKGAFRVARLQGHSQAETARAVGSLVSKGVLSRRNLTVEMDEVR